ncbi:hypothetical protein Cadr_000006689 [Camelus dromedarius]|uniref:Uncharacterized protein n=1 Tax=Camelus dromedarius TaxID=9838 RepID=A0A5N4E595_CAMDR|nr:hypothetical protein Cadr_000006689 [Camelus dromedarius]
MKLICKTQGRDGLKVICFPGTSPGQRRHCRSHRGGASFPPPLNSPRETQGHSTAPTPPSLGCRSPECPMPGTLGSCPGGCISPSLSPTSSRTILQKQGPMEYQWAPSLFTHRIRDLSRTPEPIAPALGTLLLSSLFGDILHQECPPNIPQSREKSQSREISQDPGAGGSSEGALQGWAVKVPEFPAQSQN